MPDLVPWRVEPVAPPLRAGTLRADRLRVRADYPITGVALVLQAAFLEARRDVGRLESSYGDSERDGVTRDPSLAGLLAVSRERHEAIREEWTRALTDPLASLTSAGATDVSDPATAAFLEAYAALEDLLVAHPDGLPPERVGV